MIKKEKEKFILYSKDGKKKLGSFDTKKEAEDREAEINRIKHAKGALVEVSLSITKASLHADGTMRWLATCSDTGKDKTGEATSLSLFNDWIERVETGKSVSFLPDPRQPFLGLSHYPDLDGYGEAGLTDKMLVDGVQFKAGGTFYKDDDHPLGKALFEAIRTERALIKKGEMPENPIRISAGWWDLAHQHGDFVFERKSLTDICPMCKNGAGDKVYLKGQLDHFAATRVPINPRTSLALEEKAMTTRKEDALSIIEDEELAAELDKRAKLVGKSETEELPEGMVTKADEETLAEIEAEKADVEKMPMEEEENYYPFGGAMSLKEAEEYMAAQSQAAELYSQWGMLQTVMGNILEQSEPKEIKGRMQSLITEFSTRVDAIKAAVEDIVLLQQDIGGNSIMSDTEKAEVINTTLDNAVQDALNNPQLSREQKAEAIQQALQEYAETIKAQLDAVNPPDPGEAITKAMMPIVEKLDLIAQKLNAAPQVQPRQPVQKSLVPGGAPNPQQGNGLPVSPITGEPSKLRAMINRSVGMQQ